MLSNKSYQILSATILVMVLILCVTVIIKTTRTPSITIQQSITIPATLGTEKLSFPSLSVYEFWMLSQAGKIEEASQLLTNRYGITILEGPVDVEKSEMIYKYNFKFLRIESIKLKEDRALVIINFIDEGRIREMAHFMFKDNGTWKISSMDTITPALCRQSQYFCEF